MTFVFRVPWIVVVRKLAAFYTDDRRNDITIQMLAQKNCDVVDNVHRRITIKFIHRWLSLESVGECCSKFRIKNRIE